MQILCGFSVAETASAFLVSTGAMEKRLQRAKATLAVSREFFDLNGQDVSERLSAVERALYLLFNEGYHGAHPESAIREELCQEALRLCALLLEHSATAQPQTYALGALMCLHAARLRGRYGPDGGLHTLEQQDRAEWDLALVDQGRRLLELSATGSQLSEYHVEAAIAHEHTTAPSSEQTNWARIVELYDVLLSLRQSPVVTLCRAIALSRRDGPEAGLIALRGIADAERLARYPFFAAAFGDLELRAGRPGQARPHFERALALARNPAEQRFFGTRLAACRERAVER